MAIRRNQLSVFLAGAGVVLLILFAGLMLLPAREPEPEPGPEPNAALHRTPTSGGAVPGRLSEPADLRTQAREQEATRVPVEVPARPRDRGAPQATARIRVTVTGLPNTGTRWLELRIRAQQTDPRAKSHPHREDLVVARLASPHGRLDYSTPFPADREFRILVSSFDQHGGSVTSGAASSTARGTTRDVARGIAIGLRSPLHRLARNQTHHQRWDLREEPTITFQLTGLPTAALSNQRVHVFNPGSRPQDRRYCAGNTDPSGHVRMHGFDAERIQVSLAAGGGDLSLRLVPVAPAHKTNRSKFVRLVPRERLVGFQFVGDSERPPWPSLARFDSLPLVAGARRRVPLLKHDRFLSSSRCHFYVNGMHFSVRSTDLAEVDGLCKVRIPEGRGKLRVITTATGEMFVTPVATTPTYAERTFLARRKGAWSVQGLRPGSYQLWAYRDGHLQRAGDPCAVLAGKTTTVRWTPAATEDWHGRIANWQQVPKPLRPNRLLLMVPGGAALETPIHRATGRFALKTHVKIHDATEFRLVRQVFSNPLRLIRVETDARNRKITGHCPLDLRRVRIRVPPRFGGRIELSFPRPGTQMALLTDTFLSRTRQRANAEGWVTVYSDRDEIQGMINEFTKEGRVCRGWFRVPSHIDELELDPGGRHVTLLPTAGSRIGAAATKPPSWWRFGRPGFSAVRIQGAQRCRIWMPDSADGLELLTRTGIPLLDIGKAEIGSSLQLR